MTNARGGDGSPTTGPRDRLTALGLELPLVPTPLGSYAPAVHSGSLVFTSGQLPSVGGVLQATGRVGAEVSPPEAVELARLCALNGLAAIDGLIGLERVVRVVKVTGFVASAPDFTAQPAVVNGASDLLTEVFGPAGVHARSAVGVSVLPMNAPVEIEITVEVN